MIQNIKNHIKEIVIDSSCGESWGEENIHFHKAYKMAMVIYSYLSSEKKVSIDKLNELEVEQMLRLQIPMHEMYSQGIYFLKGWKSLVKKIGKLQKEEVNPSDCPALFLECLQYALTINIYEKLTEFPEAEWIFEQKVFLKKMAGFVWLWEAVNYEKQEELVHSMQNGLVFLFEEKEVQHRVEQKLLKMQDEVENISKDERFIFVLGSLFMETADAFSKICAFTEQGFDEVKLGRIMLEKIVEKELEQTDDSVFKERENE